MAKEAIGNAYLNVIPKWGDDASSSIAQQATEGLGDAAGSAGEAFGSTLLSGMKGPLIGAGVALSGVMGLASVAEGLMGIGQTFDDMRDTIVVGTGASGEALDALCESAKEIATTVPTSFESAGDIVEDLNTRMGLVGDDLEAVGERVVAVGSMLGQEVDISALTGAFNAFGIANEDAAAKMDYLFSVGQNTGIGFNELTSIIESNAPALQNLGFSFEESANMAGLLDKAGMDASGTMGKMSKALVELAQPGQSAADAYRGVVEQMQGYIEAGDTAAAIDVASTVFGTRGAAQFVGAVQSGALSLDELSNAALGAGEGIMGTMEATMDWPERWELLKNKATEALEPLGGALMDGASAAMEKLSEALDAIDPSFFDQLAEGVAGFIEGGAQALVDGIQWAIDNKDAINEGIKGFVDGVQNVIGVLTTVADVVGTTLKVAGDTLGTIFSLMCGDVEGAADGIANAADTIGDKLGFPGLGDTVRGVFDDIATFMEDPIGNASEAIGDAVDWIIDDLGVRGLADDVSATFDDIGEFMEDPIGNAAKGIAGWAEDVAADLGFPGLSNTVSDVFDSIASFMEDPIGNAVDAIRGFVDDILAAFNFDFELPELKLPHIVVGSYIDVPVIGRIPDPSQIWGEWYAKGGIVDDAQIIGAGERGPELVWPSYEPYLSQYADAIGERIGTGGGITINLNYEAGADANEMVRDIARGLKMRGLAGVA